MGRIFYNWVSRRVRHTTGLTTWSYALVCGLSLCVIMAPPATAKMCHGTPTQTLIVPGKLDPHHLLSPGWTPAVKQRLEQLIAAGAHKGLPVVFDFDDTVLCRDIGDATLVTLVKDGMIRAEFIPEEISPAFELDGKWVILGRTVDPIGYYEALMQATAHHASDTAPYTTAYAWLTQMMRGLTPEQIVQATHKVFAHGRAERDLRQIPGETFVVPPMPGKSIYRVPFFYPEMVELLAVFLINGYDVWIVSASNPWSVRWLVTRYLNHLFLTRYGLQPGIASHHVIGLASILQGHDNRLYKDTLLAQESPPYARMDTMELTRYHLTTQLIHPVPMYDGKVATIFQWTGQRPYLAAGNSANDHPMLRFAQHRLWIAQLDQPTDQQKVAEIISASGEKDSWLIQPVLNKQSPGLVSTEAELSQRLSGRLDEVRPGQEILKATGLLNGF